LGGRGRWISEFEASLVYSPSFRTARATQRNPVWGGGEKKEERGVVCRGFSSVVEHLPSKRKALGLVPSSEKKEKERKEKKRHPQAPEL